MPNDGREISLPFAAKLARTYLRSGLRGKNRLTFYFARKLSALQAVPIRVAGATLYVDLRFGGSHDLLQGSPWAVAPAETEEQALMRRVVRRGDVAFDIGANIGLHTLLLSQLVGAEGRVIAFEPNPELQTTLGLTIKSLPNARLLPVALSDQSGVSTLFIPDDHSMSSLADWTKGRLPGEAHQATCDRQRLDDLVDAGLVPHPDFIKCDVEGAELMVFRGGRKTLDRSDAPVILFEMNVHTARGFNLDVTAAMDFLASLELPQYRFFQQQGADHLVETHSAESVHSNVLAVPAAKVDRTILRF